MIVSELDDFVLPPENELLALLDAANCGDVLEIRRRIADLEKGNYAYLHLLSNAIKFTESGGSIRLSATEDENKVTFTMSDTGIGILEGILSDLFQIDAKTRQIGTEGEQGTGLGLILCKEFIDRHGGELWVESEVGRGSTFLFTLPKNPT